MRQPGDVRAAQNGSLCMSGRLLRGCGGVPDAQRVRQARIAGDVLVSVTLLPWPDPHPVMDPHVIGLHPQAGPGPASASMCSLWDP